MTTSKESVEFITHKVGSKEFKYKKMFASIKEADGTVVFESSDVEVPENWSQTASDILAQKYFRKTGVPATTVKIQEDKVYPEFYRSEPVEGTTFGFESSAHQVFVRLAGCWTYWGIKSGYFTTKKEATEFYEQCYFALYYQIASPNSPQWFNTGLNWAYGIAREVNGADLFHMENGKVTRSTLTYIHPQVHACYIQSIDDKLLGGGGIMDLFTREAGVFKYGSGSGSNYSAVRGKGENLVGGGYSSGLMSFLRVGDRSAGAIKSGGTTRRAARMVVVDVDHPEIEEYVSWKTNEENKVAALITGSKLNKRLIAAIVESQDSIAHDKAVAEAWQYGVPGGLIQRAIHANTYGYTLNLAELDNDWQGEAYETVSGQNANNSVSIPDEFMEAVEKDTNWNLIARTNGAVMKTIKARKLWDDIVTAAWSSADPGVHFNDSMNNWNTVANDERIRATNPCCFVGETLVDTAEGRIRFDELEFKYRNGEKMPFVWSFSRRTGMPVLRQISAVWVAGKAKKLVRVTTENGITLTCTPEHRFLLRKGYYVEAQDLKAGDSLRKVSRSKYGHRVAINHRPTKEYPNGTQYQSRYMWQEAFGELPEGYEVHHINEDKHDDRLSNFKAMTKRKHKRMHAKGENNARFIEMSDELLIEIADAVSNWQTVNKTKDDGKVTPNRWNRYVREQGLEGEVPIAHTNGRIQGVDWNVFLERIEEARCLVNDRVLSVEEIELDSSVKVYDMEVRGTRNFAVTDSFDPFSQSIIVHNSEYIFLDDTACNLASLNLVALMNESKWNVEVFAENLELYSRLFTTVLDISIEMAQFVSEPLARKTFEYRTLGLGYANLGSLIMRLGMAYGDSDSCHFTSAITSIMTGAAYSQSAELAKKLSPFPGYSRNASPFKKVIHKHKDANSFIKTINGYQALTVKATKLWVDNAKRSSFRNAQVTVIAPTGTIGLVMDCDTTGIEPDFSLIKMKKLAGGGYMKLVNSAVPQALENLGYNEEDRSEIIQYLFGHGCFSSGKTSENMIMRTDLINAGVSEELLTEVEDRINTFFDLHGIFKYLTERSDTVYDLSFMLQNQEVFDNTHKYIFGHGTIEGCDIINEADLPVFACAVAPAGGSLVISPMDHLNIVAAAQPFISGGASKTINMPESATVKDISDVYFAAFHSGIKCVSVYRDGSKLSQPLMASVVGKIKKTLEETKAPKEEMPSDEAITTVVKTIIQPHSRNKLPPKRRGYTQKAGVGGQAIYVRTGEYTDGRLGEVFLDMYKEGASFRSLMNSFAIAVSLGLQYGVPLEEFVEAFVFTKFEPAGMVTGHENVKNATSIIDFIFRDLAINYLGRNDLAHIPPKETMTSPANEVVDRLFDHSGDSSDHLILRKEETEVVMTKTTSTFGFSGDACPSCNNFTLVRSGTCMTCSSCGSTTGCS